MRRPTETAEAWPRVLVESGAAVLAFVLGILAAASFHGDAARASQSAMGAKAAQVPRFESLKSDRVNLRNGPGQDYPIAWLLTRVGLPVEIVREVDGWRQVRDADGSTGWVSAALLSARRTAVVTGRNYRPGLMPLPLVDLYEQAGPNAKVTARVEAGVVVSLVACDGTWCQVSIDGKRGHVAQTSLWGVYPGERIR